MPQLSILRRRGAAPRRFVVRLEVEREADGRWIAEIPDLPGVMCYGETRQEAINNAAFLALRVIDERVEHGERLPDFDELVEVREPAHQHA